MIFDRTNLVSNAAINILARNYSTLDYYVTLKSHLETVYPYENFEHLTKYELHSILNKVLIENYAGEEILKYKLFEYYVKKRNIVGAFEMNVNNSRADFLIINGETTCYEIKSALDNLNKLNKQMADYMLAFEYNYLVVDERHVQKAYELLPKCFGLWSYKDGKYRKLEKAELNKKIDAEMQLKLLSKKELLNTFPEEQGIFKKILHSYQTHIINLKFKEALKSRYRQRWNFLIANYQSILPIDIQFFFNTNIQPKYVYYI